jgi:hypothetical protein
MKTFLFVLFLVLFLITFWLGFKFWQCGQANFDSEMGSDFFIYAPATILFFVLDLVVFVWWLIIR